ncbi:acyltransferase family protein [Aerolutibacter daejeonensis]|nr:acyltransferase family protein [Lysobacter daejeonensis]
MTFSRRHDLDWVRVAAFGLLVLYHVGMYYVSWDWHVKSPFTSPALEPLMLLTSPWRLSLLFLISGVATAFLLANRPQRFLVQRSWRLLLPLIFGMFVIVVPQAYFEVAEKLGYSDGYASFYKRYLMADTTLCRDTDCLDLPTWNHLWFVAYLWVYTIALVALRRVFPNSMARMSQVLSRRLRGAVLLLAPAILLAVVRLALVARFESTHGLVDDWYNHAQYLPLFLAGYWLATAENVWNDIERLRWPATALALASYVFIAWYFSRYTDTNPPPDALRMVQRGIWGLDQWASIVAILGWARRWVQGDGPVLRYLSSAVFPVYILHQTLIVAFAHWAKPLALMPVVEGPLLVLATFAASFAGYEAIRRVRWLRPLFGLKRLPPAQADSRYVTTSCTASPPR